jgi:hypothetical protein
MLQNWGGGFLPLNKQVDFALEVPGGFVVAVLQPATGNFDESVLEAHFHTMRVLNYPGFLD